jgi:LPXTG-motif cell wall-anchored protein
VQQARVTLHRRACATNLLVRRRRPLLTIAALAASLALPSAALAQSAGDDQYTDPFSGQEAPAQGDNGGSQGDSGSAPPPASGGDAGTAPAQEAPPAEGGNGEAAGETLPRTGPPEPVPLLAAAGCALLLGGFAIRRRA